MTCDHCKKWGKTSRCGRCRIAHYCSATCQKEAWVAHKGFCHKPSEASAVEQQAMRDRVKSGQAVPSNFGWASASTGAGEDHEQKLEREFVLASGERTVATSNREPDFSVFSLPHYFEWTWPMHELLPNELAPLKAPFYVKTNMYVHRYWEALCPAPIDYAASSTSSQHQFMIEMISQGNVASIQGSVMKFVELVPRLRDAVKLGQPEATARWKKGCEDMSFLLYWRWQRNSLTRPPFAVVPVAPRFYELDSFRPESKEENGSAQDQAERESRANETDVKLQHDYFVLRMPANPFPRAPEPAHDTGAESKPK